MKTYAVLLDREGQDKDQTLPGNFYYFTTFEASDDFIALRRFEKYIKTLKTSGVFNQGDRMRFF